MNVMSEQFLQYNVLDSCCTLQARNEFWDELKDGYMPAYQMTMRMLEPLIFMQTRGLKVDLPILEVTKVEIEKALAAKEEELNKVVGRPLNANSPQQVAQYFYIEKGIPPYLNSEGGVTTDDGALQRLAKPTAKRKGFREAKLIQEIRGYVKLKSSYLEVVVDADGRLRCSWNPRGTKFGRLSSSETVFGTGLNLQNLHPLFKKFIRADDDCFFVEVDKRQAEWVIMAYLSQDGNMLKVIEEGRDPHLFTASMMFNVPEEIVLLDNKVVGYERDPEIIIGMRAKIPELERLMVKLPRNYGARQVGKHANHGLNYDEGYIRFALEWELQESYAKWCVERYHQVYPGIRRYYEWVKKELNRDRTLINCFGRKMRFMDQWGNDLFKAAYASLPQSTQVDGLNGGLCAIYEDPYICDSSAVNGDLMAQVHDSILLQFPNKVLLPEYNFYGIMKHVYDLVSPEMEYHNRRFKIPTDMKAGRNWGAFQETNPLGMQEVVLGESPVQFLSDLRTVLGVKA